MGINEALDDEREGEKGKENARQFSHRVMGASMGMMWGRRYGLRVYSVNQIQLTSSADEGLCYLGP